MLFNSLAFAAFLPMVLALYYGAPVRHRKSILLVASYVFYGFWDWRFCGLLALSSFTDYHFGRYLYLLRDNTRRRRGLLIASLVVNLGALGFFKYYNFFATSLSDLLAIIGLRPHMGTLNVILPVGISFYTFQSLTYTIDIYRGRLKPAESLRDFLLYVSFFPQLVAGPIERAIDLLPQVATPRTATRAQVSEGFALIASGYFKKVVIGDQVAPIADRAFEAWRDLSSTELWLGLIAFSAQIYCDFSGYTDIARGVAKWFGVDLTLNFRQPYFSRNITEFWRRWHISLSSFLRDYLYIPLGGNRRGRARTYINLMITMLLGGLWHGASATFVIWGALHGAYLAAHKLLSSDSASGSALATRDMRSKMVDAVRAVIEVLGTNLLVMLAWVFFRAQSADVALGYITRMFELQGEVRGDDVVLALFIVLAVALVDFPGVKLGNELISTRLSPLVRVVHAALILAFTLLVMQHETVSRPFIYFQF